MASFSYQAILCRSAPDAFYYAKSNIVTRLFAARSDDSPDLHDGFKLIVVYCIAIMPKSITIRDIDDDVSDELSARAALTGRSLRKRVWSGQTI